MLICHFELRISIAASRTGPIYRSSKRRRFSWQLAFFTWCTSAPVTRILGNSPFSCSFSLCCSRAPFTAPFVTSANFLHSTFLSIFDHFSWQGKLASPKQVSLPKIKNCKQPGQFPSPVTQAFWNFRYPFTWWQYYISDVLWSVML